MPSATTISKLSWMTCVLHWVSTRRTVNSSTHCQLLAQKDVTQDRLDRFWRQSFSMVTSKSEERTAAVEVTKFTEHVKATFEREREFDGCRLDVAGC